MNELTHENKLPFKFYAVHSEGDVPGAEALIDSTDIKGRPWELTFLWGTDEFNKEVGEVRAFPTYYILDEQATPRAMIVGHNKKTVNTIEWLIDQIQKRDS